VDASGEFAQRRLKTFRWRPTPAESEALAAVVNEKAGKHLL
jgi:hypothetical protein